MNQTTDEQSGSWLENFLSCRFSRGGRYSMWLALAWGGMYALIALSGSRAMLLFVLPVMLPTLALLEFAGCLGITFPYWLTSNPWLEHVPRILDFFILGYGFSGIIRLVEWMAEPGRRERERRRRCHGGLRGERD